MSKWAFKGGFCEYAIHVSARTCIKTLRAGPNIECRYIIIRECLNETIPVSIHAHLLYLLTKKIPKVNILKSELFKKTIAYRAHLTLRPYSIHVRSYSSTQWQK